LFFFLFVRLKFWKVGSRKVFAVRKQETGNSCIEINSDDDNKDDDFKSTPKKRKINIEGVLNEVKEMRRDVKLIFHMSENMPVPPGLYKELYESFMCNICMSRPARPPIIYTRCCNRILGCQTCVDGWYRVDGVAKKCPICRHEREVLETSVLKA
jgi:hypothetical protein